MRRTDLKCIPPKTTYFIETWTSPKHTPHGKKQQEQQEQQQQKKLLLVYDTELLNPHTKETNRKSIQNWKETKMIEGRDWKGLRKDLMDRTVVTDWNCEDRKKASCRTETPSKYTITISCCSRIEREKEIFG